MFKLTERQANTYAVVFFILTIVLSYSLPEHTITYTGFLLVIILSVFVKGNRPTIIAAIVSALLVLGFLLLHPFIRLNPVNITKHAFVEILIFFVTLLVLHIKNLYSHMEYDKSHMTSLFENATEGIILANQNAEIVLVNPTACKIFDYKAEELIGQKIEVLLPDKYRAGHVKLRQNFYDHPENRVMGTGRDLYGQKKNGDNFPVEVSLSSYKENNNQFVIAFVVDITHRKEIEKNILQQQEQLEKVTNDIRKMNIELEGKVEERTIILKEALQRLEQSQQELSEALDKERQLSEIKSRFVSMASHEFRTPLSAVLSSASLLAKYTTTEQQINRDKHINRIKDSVKHLNDILEDFLSLGKLDEGKIGAQFDHFNLQDVIYDTIDEVRGLVKDEQDIVYNHNGDEVIFSDKKLLKNILINLISNALKFSKDDSIVRIESLVQNGTVNISVVDKGVGIAEEDQQHLFSSFFRGKNAINIQGTGLGLHIVKRYTDLLGGTIKLESKISEGTTVYLTIPIKENSYGKNNPGN